MNQTERVSPRIFRGLRDLLPEEMVARQWMIDQIRQVYERYGFLPLDTPAIEYLDILTDPDDVDATARIFRVRNPDDVNDKEKTNRLGLRFDLTVPLARVISQYRNLPRPFRRYQVASVWRVEKPDPGRFCQFVQFDLDSVGVASEVADVEIIAAMSDTLTALNVGSYRVKFSSRRILNLLPRFAGIPDKETYTPRDENGRELRPIERSAAHVFRVLDKLDKIGGENMRRELTTGYKEKSGDWIPGLGLTSEQVDRIEKFVAIRAPHRDEVVRKLSDLFSAVPDAAAEIDVLARMSRQLALLGCGNDRVTIDLSVARGLAYYTGPVFEAVLLDAPQFGAVFGGGRYDELVTRFSGERVPATGASIGVDRLLAALQHLGRLKHQKGTAKAMVAVIDREMMDEYLTMAFELRGANIPAELYLGNDSIGKQFKYADQLGIPVVVVYGGNEKSRGVVTIKNMRQGKAQSAQVAERADWVKQRPGQTDVPYADWIDAVRATIDAVERGDA